MATLERGYIGSSTAASETMQPIPTSKGHQTHSCEEQRLEHYRMLMRGGQRSDGVGLNGGQEQSGLHKTVDFAHCSQADEAKERVAQIATCSRRMREKEIMSASGEVETPERALLKLDGATASTSARRLVAKGSPAESVAEPFALCLAQGGGISEAAKCGLSHLDTVSDQPSELILGAQCTASGVVSALEGEGGERFLELFRSLACRSEVADQLLRRAGQLHASLAKIVRKYPREAMHALDATSRMHSAAANPPRESREGLDGLLCEAVNRCGHDAMEPIFRIAVAHHLKGVRGPPFAGPLSEAEKVASVTITPSSSK